MDFLGEANADYVEAQYRRWVEAPESVSSQWRAFFQGFSLSSVGERPAAAAPPSDALSLQSRAERLIYRYRDLGHLLACLDPLTACPTSHPLLDLEAFGLTREDLDRGIHAPEFSEDTAPLGRVVEILRETYCRDLGVEYMHLQDPGEREWLRGRMEATRNRTEFSREESLDVLEIVARAGRFEEFLQKRYLGQTRFSMEGAESVLVLLRDLVARAAEAGAQQVVLGMAHRGRLNVQVHLLGKTYPEVFCQFEASYDSEAVPGGGDVKYHSGYRGAVDVGGVTVGLVMPENPSHLEAVNPVVAGIARCLQDQAGDPRAILPVLVHGDSAFSGQGIVAESLNLSQLEGYSTGGVVHVVLNNQIGYTTLPEDARSTRYATDPAKMLMVPIFHVHGEDPAAVLHAGRLALAYRNRFGKDVVLDVIGYRRYGHNEGDEPYFTQPLLYERIQSRPPLYELYGRELSRRKITEEGAVEELLGRIDGELEAAHEEATSQACRWHVSEPWDGYEELSTRYSHEPVETGVEEARLRELGASLTAVPEGFHLYKKLDRILERRGKGLEEGEALDWTWAESLAFATLLVDGTPIRLSGEDSRRGTFSQRHAVWFDTETGEEYAPLAHLGEDQATFRAYDSPLSEAGVVGFEYGYSAADPKTLVLWEAQYGDFANGAQVIIDQFVASGEAKWQRPNGLVLLLPHGYEGQGPDHSTSRVERFLELCAEDNLQVCQPSTPAQYFHLLRRQVKRPFRKPLVVLTPKSLLRHPEVVSPLGELASGHFQEVLGDGERPEGALRRILLCSGKVFYELRKRRREAEVRGVALARVEQFYPFPEDQLRQVLEGLEAETWCWVQEEPANMGAWPFLRPRLEELLGRRVRYVGRRAAASPATGFPFIHREEQESLLAEALGSDT